jgi:RNA polymerase sigma factor (sigma-70 family)
MLKPMLYYERTVSASDRELIRSCRKGDARAWQRVVEKYERLVYSVPLNYGLSHEDAADVAQTTFTILIKSFHTLSDDSPLGSWLATVARRHTWRLLDRKRREDTSEYEDVAESAVSVSKGDTESAEQWELTEWVHHGLSLIGEPCRELLLALFFDPTEPSYAEVAKRLNIPVGSIGPTRARCLQRLTKALKR